jgi:hypothetical protein
MVSITPSHVAEKQGRGIPTLLVITFSERAPMRQDLP